jgi:YesN/AraC family two-component response regulator
LKGNHPENSTPNFKPLKKKLGLHFILFIFITVVLFFVKLYFERDLGDYIIGTVLSVLLYITSFVILKNAGSITNHAGGKPEDKPKYEKSSLTREKKDEILKKIKDLMEQEKYFTRNTLTLADISKKVNEPPHHVSQVINEKLKKSFFDVLSAYRVDEAKRLISGKETGNLTIEDIAERVGYNSKASFNKAFRKYTGQTPSEFRKNLS